VRGQLIRSVDFVEEVLSGVSEVGHQELQLLSVLSISALGNDGRGKVRVLFSETLLEQVFLAIVGLVMDHLVRDHDVLVAEIFARLLNLLILFFLVALEQTQGVVLFDYSLSALFNMKELFPIEGFLASHLNNY